MQIGTGSAQQNINSLSSTLRSIGSTMSLAITAPLAGIATAAISSAADFEQSLNIMEQVSGATGEQMAALQAQALQLGADTSFSAGEAAEGMLELAKAGMTAEQTGQAIEGVMSLAAAGGIELAEAAKVTSAALNAFGLEASESTRVADLLAAAANASAADISDLSQGLQQGGFAFDATGQKVEDLVASLAILTNKGLTGSDAGTALKNAMMRLINPTKEAKELMDELGIEVYDAQGKMKPFEEILGEFRQALYETNAVTVTNSNLTGEQAKRMKYLEGQIQKTKTKLADYASGVAGVAQSENDKVVSVDRLNRTLAALQAEYTGLAGAGSTTSTVLKTLTEEERNSALATILLSDGAKAFIPILEDGVESFVEMRDAVTEQGAASETANARMKGFNGAIEYLKGSIDSFLIGTALPFLDMFGGLVRYVADAVTAFGSLSQPVKNAALAFAAVLAAIGPTLLVISGMIKAWASFKGMLLLVKAALLSVSWPVWVIVGAIAALGVAWAYNWGGIREKTQAVIDLLRPGFAELLGWISSAMQGDFGPLKAGLQGALQQVNATIQAFKWSDFVASLNDWGTYIQGLVWGTVLPVLTDWGVYINSLVWSSILPTLSDWGTYIANLDWTRIVTTAIDWAMWIPALTWTAIIAQIEWQLYIGSLAWSAFISALDWASTVGDGIAWSSFIPSLNWGDLIAAIDWATYIATFAWESFVTKLEWTGAITKLENWGAYIASVNWRAYINNLVWSSILPTLSSWGGYIVGLDWKQIITTAIDWATWIPALAWAGFVTALAWSAYIAVFSWSTYVSVLNWTAHVAILSWRSFVSNLTWENFVKAMEWGLYLVKIAWGTYVKAVDWTTWIIRIAWSSFVKHLQWIDFVAKLSGWDAYVPDLAWKSFVASVDLASYIPDFGSWYDYIKTFFSNSDPATNAGGTSYGYGQFSTLNERGRELVSFPSDQGILPPGSRVYTNGQSNRMLAGAGAEGGITINMSGITIANDRDLHQLANDLGSLLRRKR